MKLNFCIEFYIKNKLEKIQFSKNYSNEIIDIEIITQNNSLKINLSAKEEIILKSFYGETNHKFNSEDKIFVNGYQSWTDTREYFVSEKMSKLPAFAKLLNPIFKFKQYGDYNFFTKKLKTGDFYGFATAYIKNGNNFHYFISENEDFAHTVFLFSRKSEKIYFIVDCENVVINQKTTILNFIENQGDYQNITNYFKSISINQSLKPKTGWTSWYNYYQNINQDIILNNLNNFSNYFPAQSIFQIDDGFQTYVGDWLNIDKVKFPAGLSKIVEQIHKLNYQAGLWLAPFAAETKSELVKNHPDWILKDKNGKKIFGGSNWSKFYALDFYNQEFRTYLKHVFDTILLNWKFDIVKLDFLYSVALIPQHGKSRAKMMSEAMSFLREIVGDKQILACGVPIAQAFNKVEYCRIGADISLDWNGKFYEKLLHRERVSTYNSLKNTIFRHFLDKSVFLNDPDVFLLRDENIKLTKIQKITVFLINSIFGSLVFTSDDFSKYNLWQRQLLQNLQFFHSAKVSTIKHDNDLYEYYFQINDIQYVGFSNLSKKVNKINSLNYNLLDIFTLKILEDKNKGILNAYETKIYER